MSNKKKDKSNYHCTVEWHILDKSRRSPFAIALYFFGLRIAKDGYFYCSGYRLADYFDCERCVIYDAIKVLVKLGFWIPVGSLPDGRKQYKVLYHREWAAANPGRCVSKNEVEEDLGESELGADPVYAATLPPVYVRTLPPVYAATLKSSRLVFENKSTSSLNAKRLDAPLSLEQAGQGVVEEPNYLPLAEWKQVVEDLTGERVFFPEDHHDRYRQFIKEYGNGAVIAALKEFCINNTNSTFKYRLFSTNFLAAASVILAAREIGFTERKAL